MSQVINWRNMFDQSEKDARNWLFNQDYGDLAWMLKSNDTNGNYAGLSKLQLELLYWEAWEAKHPDMTEFIHNGVKFKCRPVDAKDYKEYIDQEEMTGETVERLFCYKLWYYYKATNDPKLYIEFLRESHEADDHEQMKRIIDENHSL